MLSNTVILQRATKVAEYIVEHHATVRKAAEVFGISKSTVYTDVTDRIRYVDGKLYQEVEKVLIYNLSQRAIRGGEATRKKYKKQS